MIFYNNIKEDMYGKINGTLDIAKRQLMFVTFKVNKAIAPILNQLKIICKSYNQY